MFSLQWLAPEVPLTRRRDPDLGRVRPILAPDHLDFLPDPLNSRQRACPSQSICHLRTMQDQLDHLLRLAARIADGPGKATGIPRLNVHSGHCPTPPVGGLMEPKVCLVLQGAKQIMIGEQVLRYDPAT